MFQHPLIHTLKSLRGNARACVYTEPLWGIPFNLYSPYTSIYMLALGLSDVQIGLLTSIGLVFQVFWTVMSGAITDKWGRKRTTFIFDIVSWTIPCLIWAVAQNFTYFLAAAIVNAVWRVTHNSWQCLLVEDTDSRLLVDIYSWVYIAGLLAAFVSPLTGVLIGKFSLVPTIRGLYLLAVVMMTAKFIVLNALATETQQGVVRMRETQHQPLFAVLRDYPAIFKQILRTPLTLLTLGLMLMLGINRTISGTFWGILVTEKLMIPAHHLALYPFAKSMTMLLFFFLVMPRLRHRDTHKLMMVGFTGLLISDAILISLPAQNYWLLLLTVLLEACSVPLASTLLDTLIVININAEERARIMAILTLLVIVVTSPFGWIAGQMSAINRSLPFVLNLALAAGGVLLTFLTRRQTATTRSATYAESH
ncbi:MAG TPA: MFS transporter [Anaerolineae bacterium]|nr:MFS transporter [Anaerolineae bacterium]